MAKETKSNAINLRDSVTVIATDKAPQHAKGDKITCHPKLAEHFVKKGYATAKAEKAA